MKTTENGTSTGDTHDYCEEMRTLAERVCTLATKAVRSTPLLMQGCHAAAKW